ncbi:4Fe-4S single cluster domain-containing protein [Undibacterium sp. TS12]|uniref:4Fe-4S single cluster domain-containing protein n=1 Tax=Undibacterium sp. TS12 TaxID=2908202 RepID=UPI001F4CB4E3|nr:4Fe-4S single cluster domain-containing protein [Undibacterium sp. TS12]MCH8621584.1 radical SAM protein [Undibacterium sp. TS12]
MKIAINKAHFPVTVLGPGRRIGIWLQGCSIGCKDCVSQDTWARDSSKEMTVARLLSWCREVSAGQFDGITISGGEPFDQPLALKALLDGLLHWRSTAGLDVDILCYSGYPLATLQKKHTVLLEKLDALIPEPFVASRPLTQAWRGSSNQPLVLLSDRGRARMQAYVDAPITEHDKRIQTMVDGQRVWYVGIPGRGDMQALEQRCAERGLQFEHASWRS